MSDTLSARKVRRHLRAAGHGETEQTASEAAQSASEHAAEAFRLAVGYATARPDRPALNQAAALRLDQAELFLLSLDMEMLTADGPRAAYLLGLCESHLANMIELVRGLRQA